MSADSHPLAWNKTTIFVLMSIAMFPYVWCNIMMRVNDRFLREIHVFSVDLNKYSTLSRWILTYNIPYYNIISFLPCKDSVWSLSAFGEKNAYIFILWLKNRLFFNNFREQASTSELLPVLQSWRYLCVIFHILSFFL